MRTTMMMLVILSFCVTAFAAGNSRTMTVTVDRAPALAVQLLDDWSSESDVGKIRIISGRYETQIGLWDVKQAKAVQEAVGLVPQIIKRDVIDFKALEARDITVAGTTGKHLIGTGTEANDGDSSNAEVYVFSVDGKVFLLCAHGQGAGASKARSSILTMLATAKRPRPLIPEF